MATKAFAALPAITSSTACTAPPTARSAASKLPGDIEVSASSRTRPCFGAASRIARRSPSDGRARSLSSARSRRLDARQRLEALLARAPARCARSRSGRSGWPAGVRWSRQAGWVMSSVDMASNGVLAGYSASAVTGTVAAPRPDGAHPILRRRRSRPAAAAARRARRSRRAAARSGRPGTARNR